MREHVCPVWVGYLLASPLRKLFQNPRKVLYGYVSEGMTVLDVGCAMGFFSLPMARMVGAGGRVICVDIQPKMLEVLRRRARRAGVADSIETRLCSQDGLGLGNLGGSADFALASAVVHEAPDPGAFFAQLFAALKKGGRLLLVEPKGHVSVEAFENTLEEAAGAGLSLVDRPDISGSRVALLAKPGP